MKHAAEIRRLHWGCGLVTPSGWINSHIKERPGVDISFDFLEGLPLDSASVNYIPSQRALEELEILAVVKPSLPTGTVSTIISGAGTGYDQRQLYHPDAGLQLYSLPFTCEFAEELLCKAGFGDVHRVAHRQTVSSYSEIVELDSREQESFYVEACKREPARELRVETEGSS